MHINTLCEVPVHRLSVKRSSNAQMQSQIQIQTHSMAAINEQKNHDMILHKRLITFFICVFFIIIHSFIYVYIHLQINILKPSQYLKSIQTQVFCMTFLSIIHIS